MIARTTRKVVDDHGVLIYTEFRSLALAVPNITNPMLFDLAFYSLVV